MCSHSSSTTSKIVSATSRGFSTMRKDIMDIITNALLVVPSFGKEGLGVVEVVAVGLPLPSASPSRMKQKCLSTFQTENSTMMCSATTTISSRTFGALTSRPSASASASTRASNSMTCPAAIGSI